MCHFEIKHIVAEASHATSHRIALISFLFSLIASKAQSLPKILLMKSFIRKLCALFLPCLKTAARKIQNYVALTDDSGARLQTILIRYLNSPK